MASRRHARDFECVVLLGAALTVACPTAAPVRGVLEPPVEPPPHPVVVGPDAAGPTADPDLVRQMHRRLDALAEVVPALTKGERQRASAIARALGQDLATDPVSGMEQHMQSLIDALGDLSEASTIDDAAAATARVAAGCGACHEASEAAVRLPDAPEPPGGSTHAARMRLHAWGVDRLWEALVEPSDERWIRGTATFAALPACTPEDPVCTRVRVVAHQAHVAEETADRVRLYGRLLAECSACHRDLQPSGA